MVTPEDLLRAVRRGNAEMLATQLGQAPAHPAFFTRAASTLLHQAVTFGRVECARVLAQAGCPVDFHDAEGRTPLHLAAWGGHIELVGLLLEAGARVDVTDYEETTPLDNAIWPAEEKSAEAAHAVLDLLLAAGADLHAIDSQGSGILHHATRGALNNARYVSIVQKLVELGVRATPGILHTIAECASWWPQAPNLARCALRAGANRQEKNRAGQTPLQVAQHTRRPSKQLLALLS